MKRLFAVVLVLAIANGLAFRDSLAGSPAFLWTLALPYLALVGLSLHH